MITYLKPEFDNAKSFYNKATVEIDENGNKHLYSYNTLVCELDGIVELMANDENITNEQYCQLYSLVLEVY